MKVPKINPFVANSFAQWFVPAIFSGLAWRKATKTHKEVKSPNGTTTGESVQSIKKQLEQLSKRTSVLEAIVQTIVRRLK